MGVDLPICIRCCFCIPLRYGLLVWGYLKLKNVKLLKIFYIYAIVLIIVQALLEVYNIIHTIYLYINIDKDHHEMLMFLTIQILISFLLLGLQIYMTTITRSEIMKLKNNYQFIFTNNAATNECTLKADDVDNAEETKRNYIHDKEDAKHDSVMQV